jgi:hypothetical protein
MLHSLCPQLNEILRMRSTNSCDTFDELASLTVNGPESKFKNYKVA